MNFIFTTTDKVVAKNPRQIHQDPAFTLELNPNKTIVIIVAAFRSGSTFLGSIFDVNPRVQYMMEPFHSQHLRNLMKRPGAIFGVRPDHTVSDWKMLYLQQMLHNCTIYQSPFTSVYHWCGTTAEHLHRFNTTYCDRSKWVNGISQQEICRYRKITVIKVIRLGDLGSLMKIVNIKSADIKIIHLLRHPVAVMMSRKTSKLFFIWDERTTIEGDRSDQDAKSQMRNKIAWEAYNYCDNHLKSINFIRDNPWFRERYMRVTHREMSLQPVEIAERVYNFVGEKLDDRIREHIFNLTGAQSAGYWKKEPKAMNIYRNSSDIITHWMKFTGNYVKYWDSNSIEGQCKQLFQYLKQPYTGDGSWRNFNFRET